MILLLASGHEDGKLPGDGTLCTSYPTLTRKSQPRVTTLEVAESPLCQRRLWQSPLPAILPPAQPTLWPHQMPSSPLNPAGLATAELPHPVLSSDTLSQAPSKHAYMPPPLGILPGAQQLWLSLLRGGEDSPPSSLASTYHSLQLLFTYLLLPNTGFQEGMVLCSSLLLTPSSRPGHTGSQLNLYYRPNRREDGWLDGRLNGKMG